MKRILEAHAQTLAGATTPLAWTSLSSLMSVGLGVRVKRWCMEWLLLCPPRLLVKEVALTVGLFPVHWYSSLSAPSGTSRSSKT